jgi:myo-inositol-1(or 4)-monophosphatase
MTSSPKSITPSEATIIETLLTAYPDHGILAEESGSEHGNSASDHSSGSSTRWTAPPTSSTAFPVYCVSIALAVKGKVEQAVIYDPSRNDLFCATKGRGAYINERRIRVSKRTQLQDQCLISTGFPYRPGDKLPELSGNMMADVMQRTAGVRRPGAAALDLAYVAAGFTRRLF